jgi:invasion protein IalB
MVGLLALSVVAATPWANQAEAESRWQIACATDKMTEKRSCAVDKGVWPDISEPYIHIMYVLKGHLWGAYTYDPARRVRVRVDDNPVLISSACGRGGCAFDEAISEVLLKQIESGKVIKVELTTFDDRVIGPYDFPTEGFQAVLSRALAGETK